jgi:hypothetical protein
MGTRSVRRGGVSSPPCVSFQRLSEYRVNRSKLSPSFGPTTFCFGPRRGRCVIARPPHVSPILFQNRSLSSPCLAHSRPTRAAVPALARRLGEKMDGGEQCEQSVSSFPSDEQSSPVPIIADENGLVYHPGLLKQPLPFSTSLPLPGQTTCGSIWRAVAPFANGHLGWRAANFFCYRR